MKKLFTVYRNFGDLQINLAHVCIIVDFRAYLLFQHTTHPVSVGGNLRRIMLISWFSNWRTRFMFQSMWNYQFPKYFVRFFILRATSSIIHCKFWKYSFEYMKAFSYLRFSCGGVVSVSVLGSRAVKMSVKFGLRFIYRESCMGSWFHLHSYFRSHVRIGQTRSVLFLNGFSFIIIL